MINHSSFILLLSFNKKSIFFLYFGQKQFGFQVILLVLKLTITISFSKYSKELLIMFKVVFIISRFLNLPCKSLP